MSDEKLCSFCEKPAHESDFLVEGPSDVTICGECISLCATMLLDAIGTPLRLTGQFRPARPLPGIRINEQIKAPEVLLLDSDGTKFERPLPIAEALRLAREKNLDLVLINASSNPPVCKILDFGTFRKPTRTE